jgi:hypothetical protein
MSYEEISYVHPKARKEHWCDWCGEKILKGEKHLSRAYKFQGEFMTGRMHLECENSMKKTHRDILSEGWTEGQFKRGETGELYD